MTSSLSRKVFGMSVAAIAVMLLATAPSFGAIVFSDDFESPDVTAAQSDGYTSGAIDTSKWVKASNGYGSGRQGIVDEAHGDFTDPVGEQAYAFRYTNSGITSNVGLIGTFGSLAAGSTITVSFDVVIDGHNDATPYSAGLVTFAPETNRNSVNPGMAAGTTAVLAQVAGNALALGEPGYLDYQPVSFTFTVGDDLVSGSAAGVDDIAVRFDGATSTAIIDNVSVDVVAIPEPASLALVGLGTLLIAGRRRGTA